MNLYPFSLAFEDGPGGRSAFAARFPFIIDGEALSLLADGRPVPSCVLSGISAGDQRFVPGRKNKTQAREGLFRFLGIDPDTVYGLYQIHSREVFVLEPGAGGAVPPPAAFAREGDGIVSLSSGVFLSVTVADCLPVFLLDRRHGFFALLHSGWKGTGIVLRALDMLETAGALPGDIAAVLGPCIQSCCYQVDRERAERFAAEFGEGAAVSREGAFFLDLQAANISLLKGRGIQHVAFCRDCTFTGERLGSFRREACLKKDASGNTEAPAYTRMAALVG